MRETHTPPARLHSALPRCRPASIHRPTRSPRATGWLTSALLLLIAAAVSPTLLGQGPLPAEPSEAAAADEPAHRPSPEDEDFCDHSEAEEVAPAGDAAIYGGPLARLEDAGVGTLMLATTQPGLYLPTPAVLTEVDYRVTGFLARARVTQRFTNPTEGWVEGIYVFPLPENAAVDALEMRIGERIVRGEIQEKEEARRTYEAAKHEGRRAALTEQQRPNLFTTAVANLGPGETVEVSLELQHELRYDQGSFELRFPMVVGPRYVPGVSFSAGSEGMRVGASYRHTSYGGHEDRLELPAGFGFARAADPPEARVESTAGPARASGSTELLQPTYYPEADNPVFLRVELDAGFPVARLGSPSHALDVKSLGAGLLAVSPRPREGWERAAAAVGAAPVPAAPVPADRDFVLTWAPRVEDAPAAAVFTQELGDGAAVDDAAGDTYALLMLLPPQPSINTARASESTADLPREVVFVLDTSGSMAGDSIRQAKSALLLALETLEPTDSFNVIEFNSHTASLFAASRPATPENLRQAGRWVGALEARGGTEMLSALTAALDGPGSAPLAPAGPSRDRFGAIRQVVFITDAGVAGEDQLFSYIAGHIGGSRLFPVGIGSAQNSHFLARAAELGRGTLTAIADAGEVEERMTGLFAKLESPVLADLEVVWENPGVESWPERIPDLYLGEPLVVAVRLPGAAAEAGRVEIRGRTAGRLWERSLSLVPEASGPAEHSAITRTDAGADLGIDRLWARRKIAALTREPFDVAAAGGDYEAARKERRGEIVRVALAHHLVSAYTSLVAVDTEVSAPAGTVPTPLPIPVSLPAGWSWEATFGSPAPHSADNAPPGVLPQGGLGLSRDLYLALLLGGAALLFFVLGRGTRPSEEQEPSAEAGADPLADTVALRVEALWGDRPAEPEASGPRRRS